MIKRLFTPLLIIFLTYSSYSQVSPKRGIAYGYHSVTDMNALKAGISWWYNWSSVPDSLVKKYYSSLGVEFVPMAWNDNYNVNNFIANIMPGAKYLLAFNEPNFNVESNMTPEQAVAAWPKIEQVAAAKGLQIVSAAPAYCGGSVCIAGYADPTVWHDKFFQLCPTCKVDYIAFHSYEATSGGVIYLTSLLKKYNRPVWVTEFANYDNNQAPADKILYMQQVVSNFENDPDIYRYSWFTGRRNGVPAINLLGDSSGTLTNLGSAYVTETYTAKKMNVPGRIVANKHYRRKGTGLENTTDGGTGQNVCYIDSTDWGEYMVNVASAGSYTMKFRVAALTNPGKFDISVNDVVVKTGVTFSATGGWQTFVDKTISGITLPAGEAYIKIIYRSNGFNLNYIDVINDINTGIKDADLETDSYELQPNPYTHEVIFKLNSQNVDKIYLKIIDMKGSVCYSSDAYYSNEDITIGNGLANGIYTVIVIHGNRLKRFKIVKI